MTTGLAKHGLAEPGEAVLRPNAGSRFGFRSEFGAALAASRVLIQQGIHLRAELFVIARQFGRFRRQ